MLCYFSAADSKKVQRKPYSTRLREKCRFAVIEPHANHYVERSEHIVQGKHVEVLTERSSEGKNNKGCNSMRNYSPYYVQLVQLLFYPTAGEVVELAVAEDVEVAIAEDLLSF